MSNHLSEQRHIEGHIDPDLPIDLNNGKVYHLDCSKKDLADNFIFVGDPARVRIVADRFDEGSIIFDGMHREIAIITGKYKGVPVTCLSTGMGTDNVEIVINEIHALKEFDIATQKWDPNGAANAKKIKIIRVGTCGSPHVDATVGMLAITRHGIGMDNTCKYYKIPTGEYKEELERRVNSTSFAQVGGCYATAADPDIVAALVKTCKELPSKRPYMVGITASGSGFYGCQGRKVGRFTLTIPNLVSVLGGIELPIKGEAAPEKVVNIEMENSALCTLSNILGYRAGTVCNVIAKRAGDVVEFAEPDEAKKAIADTITTALEAIITL